MPAKLPPEFWEEEARRLIAVLLPHITALAMEGIQNGAAKVGITINYAIYSLLAEQWAREYTDQLLKNVRTTNEAVVGDILANWIAMPGRTIGDLRAALEPWFGTKRADVIAITEATRALASGELMAFQRAGVEEIRWGTNHDELVCPLCGPLHGQVRKIGEPFGYFKWRKNAAPEPVFVPPYHPNCRCGISPVVKLRRVSFASVPNTLIIANTLAMVRPVGVYEMIKGDFEGHPFRGNQWVDGDLLHGTSSNFDEFKIGTSGAVYFSEASKYRKTQAEIIAEGRMGGRLYVAGVDSSKIKRFDPVHDEEAKKIYESILGNVSNGDLIHYSDAHTIFPVAVQHGYNYFRVKEEGGRTSVAITDPKIITIKNKVELEAV